MLDRSTNHTLSSGSSASGRPFWRMHAAARAADDGTHDSFSHGTGVSASFVPEVRPDASAVTLVEMREVRQSATLPISIARAMDGPGHACGTTVDSDRLCSDT